MSLGERLREARENADLSLKKFADLSKIQVKYLERLEGGEFNKLPASVYIQGFLKKYSELCALPYEEILGQYKQEAEVQKVIKEISLPSLPSPRFVITPKKIRWAAVIILVILAAGYLFYQLNFLVAPPYLALINPAQDSTISSSSIEIIGSADTAARLTINGEQVYIDKDGKFSQAINLSPGLNTLKIQAVNRFGKKSEITRQIIVK